MADQVLFEAGDGLSESNLGKFFGQPNIVDYVVRAVSSSIDFGNNTVDYTEGELIVTDSNNQAYLLEVDARTGLSLTDSATNHVFVEYDPTTDDAITFTINTTGTSPTDPHIKIEEIDTSADASTEFNRNPDVGIDQLTDDVDANSNDITNVGSLDSDALNIAARENFTSTFSSGQTQRDTIDNSSLGEQYIITAVPENDPGNNHGYTVDKIFWDGDSVEYEVTETENAGGGTARITIWRLGVK